MKNNPVKNNIRWVTLAILGGFIIVAYLGYRSRSNPDNCLEGLIEAGNITEITSMLNKDSLLANRKCKHGRMPLHFAAFCSKADIIKLLIEKGADINARDNNNFTPLYYARDADTAELLIKSGAKVNICDGNGYTPIHHAVNKGSKAVIKILVENGADANIANPTSNTAAGFAELDGYPDSTDTYEEAKKEQNDKETKPGLSQKDLP
jgi:ankyrin repeat protein